uniref:Inhibitor of growth protein 1 n=1 Tax=Lygus hesperus TaxID=30085 RepID=A0A0A9X7C3_LYGHE
MDALDLDHQSNNNNCSDQSPKKGVFPKIRKKIFKTTQGNDFRGENVPDWARKLYLEPLLEGWRREIVTRSTPSSRSTGNVPDVDVYYWSPEGRKLRSRPEIAGYLQVNGITKFSAVFNFSFKKQALGEEFAPYEVIRNAGAKGGRPCVGDNPNTHALQSSLKQSQNRIIVKKKNVTKHIEPKFGPILLTGDDISPEKPELSTPIQHSSASSIKKRKLSYKPSEEDGANIPEDKLYCICNDVEKGQMILCDNVNCEIGWYHFECVRLCEEEPKGSWYCPICRGPTSDEMNPSYIRDKER